jgi:archaellum component FlaG (FlaF/FlaG flagellin family)
MLGLGLGLNKRGYILSLAQRLYSAYVSRVASSGGVQQNADCDSDALSALNSSGLLSQASFILVPDAIEEDVVFSQKPNTTLGDLDFTRASDATRTNSAGAIELVPYNLFTYSQELQNVLWLTNNITIVANAGVAPDGTNTADSYASTITAGPHPCYQSKVVPFGTYTYSVYVKKVNSRYVSLKGAGGMLIWTGVIFDLDTVSVVSVQHNNVPGTTGSITSEGGGWYRISMTATSNFNDFGLQYASSPSNLFTNYGDLIIVGSGVVDYLLWGMQVVQGSSRMNYFATTDRLNVPRIDFRNANGTLNTCGRLLLEPQRTNLVPNRLLYNATTGVAYNTTVSGSPMTGVRCARITKDEAAGTLRYANQNCSNSVLAGSAGYVLSAFFKYDGVDVVTSMEYNNATQFGGVSWFQGINIASTGITLGASTSCTSTIENWGSGWYRVNVRITTGAAPSGSAVTYLMRLPSTLSTGQGFLHALPQFEAGAYPTSYIPTTSAAVTRIADVFTRNNIFTNGFITAAGGTLFLDLSDNIGYTRDSTSTGFFLDTVNGSFTNGFNIRNTGGVDSRLNISKWVAGSGTSLFTTTTTAVKIAIKWNGTTADVFVNGVKQVSATSFTTTNMQFLGSYINQVPIEINQMWLAPTPLSDAVCIQRTTL